MKYSDVELDEAVKNGIFTEDQIKNFREYINNTNSQVTKFQKVLYYGGGLLIISAMTWLMGTSWNSFGPVGITAISAAYFVLFILSGYILFFKKNMEVAGGLLFSISIAIVPLLVFSFLKTLDFWPEFWDYDDYYIWIKGKWIILELSVILVALPILIKTKFPFHIFLIAGSLWFLSMDIVPIIYKETGITWTERAHISIIFSLFMIGTGYFADIKFKKDYSFWLYLFGAVTLLSGLSVFYNDNTGKLVLLGIVNVVLILFSLFINRNVFLVFGVIGLTEFLSRISWVFFRGSVLFPFALTLIGVFLIATGIFFQKNRKKIEERFIKKLPDILVELRPKRNI